MLSAEDLVAGGRLDFTVEIPPDVLNPGDGNGNGTAAAAAPRTVRLRPLTVGDLQLASRAAKENDSLLATLLVQRSLVEPEVGVQEVAAMHAGLVEFLLNQVNRISGIDATREELAAAADAPLAKAAFVLAERFGWTPQEVSELTLGQVLLHLQMLDGRSRS